MDRVKAAYRESLAEKAIKPALAVEIKNLMENLRSALDYAAIGLFAKYGKSKSASPRIYFPYAFENQTADEFRITVENYQLKVVVVIAAINPTAMSWRWMAVFMGAACSESQASAFRCKTDA